MKTIRNFEIREDQKEYDKVQLLFDEIDNIYIVKWKWTTMSKSAKKYYTGIKAALEKYQERKKFATECN